MCREAEAGKRRLLTVGPMADTEHSSYLMRMKEKMEGWGERMSVRGTRMKEEERE